ncbi:MAG: hypothetical protein AAFN70_17270, partial [Planctomycetota bacterium]
MANRQTYYRNVTLADVAWKEGRLLEMRKLLRSMPYELRHWEYGLLQERPQQNGIRFRYPIPPDDACVMPDGSEVGVIPFHGPNAIIWSTKEKEITSIVKEPDLDKGRFSRDGSVALLRLRNGRLRFVDSRSGELLGQWSGPPSIAWMVCISSGELADASSSESGAAKTEDTDLQRNALSPPSQPIQPGGVAIVCVRSDKAQRDALHIYTVGQDVPRVIADLPTLRSRGQVSDDCSKLFSITKSFERRVPSSMISINWLTGEQHIYGTCDFTAGSKHLVHQTSDRWAYLSSPNVVKIRRISDGEVSSSHEFRHAVSCLDMSNDDRIMVGFDNGAVEIRDIVKDKTLHQLKGQYRECHNCRFLPAAKDTVFSTSINLSARLWVNDQSL